MNLRHPSSFFAFVCVVWLAAGSQMTLHGQAVTFSHFHHYPPGQYRQEGRSTMGGRPMGEPTVSTSCAASLSPEGYAAAKQFGAQLRAMNNCSAKILMDTPTTAEYVQTCQAGAGESVIHSTMHAVDDKTMTVDLQMSTAGKTTMESHLTSTYLGACPAGMAGAGGTAPKASKAECAEIAEMKEKQAKEPAPSCVDAPAAYKDRCEAAMKMMKQQTQMLEAACK